MDKIKNIKLSDTYDMDTLYEDLVYVVMITFKDDIDFSTYPKFLNERIKREVNDINTYFDNLEKPYLLSAQLSDIENNKARQLSYYLYALQRMNDNSTINRDDVVAGMADLMDELEDEWRPRQIFIYFEDRVYIGHFDSFTYSRQAETPVIQYEMKFTIIRQIISYVNYIKPPAQVDETIQSYGRNLESWEKTLDLIMSGNIELGKKEILRCKEIWTHRFQKLSDIYMLGWTPDEFTTWKSDCIDWMKKLIQALNIADSETKYDTDDWYGLDTTNEDTIYNSMTLPPQRRLYF
jgi:hypothetical protein